MGSSAILNPQGRHYQQMKLAWAKSYEDNLWPEDAIFVERNSRDFASRIERINKNAEAVAEVLLTHPRGMCSGLTPRQSCKSKNISLTSNSEASALPKVQRNARLLRHVPHS